MMITRTSSYVSSCYGFEQHVGQHGGQVPLMVLSPICGPIAHSR